MELLRVGFFSGLRHGIPNAESLAESVAKVADPYELQIVNYLQLMGHIGDNRIDGR